MSAIPIGAPGCPEAACCTASMESARMAFATRRRWLMRTSEGLQEKVILAHSGANIQRK